MKALLAFNIKVHNNFYIIKPYKQHNNILYEVFTNCEKLFTLKKLPDDTWIINENDVKPLTPDIIESIGEVLGQYEDRVE